jgi:hypothetical protein
MPKRNFNKGREERLQRLKKFKELPVKTPGSPLESYGRLPLSKGVQQRPRKAK